MTTTRSLEVFRDAVVINYGNQIMVMSKDDFDALCREYDVDGQIAESKALQEKYNKLCSDYKILSDRFKTTIDTFKHKREVEE